MTKVRYVGVEKKKVALTALICQGLSNTVLAVLLQVGTEGGPGTNAVAVKALGPVQSLDLVRHLYIRRLGLGVWGEQNEEQSS